MLQSAVEEIVEQVRTRNHCWQRGRTRLVPRYLFVPMPRRGGWLASTLEPRGENDGLVQSWVSRHIWAALHWICFCILVEFLNELSRLSVEVLSACPMVICMISEPEIVSCKIVCWEFGISQYHNIWRIQVGKERCKSLLRINGRYEPGRRCPPAFARGSLGSFCFPDETLETLSEHER